MTDIELLRTGQPPLRINGEMIAAREGERYEIQVYRVHDGGYAGQVNYHNPDDAFDLNWSHLSRNWFSTRIWILQHVPADYTRQADGDAPLKEYRELSNGIVQAVEALLNVDGTKERGAKGRILRGTNQI